MKVSKDIFLDYVGTLIGLVSLVTCPPAVAVIPGVVDSSFVKVSLMDDTNVVMLSAYSFILLTSCPEV